MERQIRIDQKVLDKYDPDKFALQTINKELGVDYEYLVGDEWRPGPPSQRPKGKRIVFENRESFKAGRDVYLAWKTISDIKSYDPVRPDEIFKRLLKNRTAPIEELYPGRYHDRPPLCLFVPWGVRPQGEFGNPEKIVLDRIRSLQVGLNQRNINAQVLIMPADLYATEINNQVDPASASKYFEEVATQSFAAGFFVKPWSEIKKENIDAYQNRADELTEERLRQMFIPAKIQEAISAAGRRSGYNTITEVQQAAFAYLRERVCEAEIIESVFKPIKVSAVSKNKDNDVDRDLPRLYIMSENLQFPWLK